MSFFCINKYEMKWKKQRTLIWQRLFKILNKTFSLLFYISHPLSYSGLNAFHKQKPKNNIFNSPFVGWTSNFFILCQCKPQNCLFVSFIIVYYFYYTLTILKKNKTKNYVNVKSNQETQLELLTRRIFTLNFKWK